MNDILPAGHHYAVMWGIPEKYAGMTSAMLHRSRAFVRLADVTVDIVTYEFREDYDAVRQQLRTRGDLIDGMRIINLWEDLATWSNDRLTSIDHRFTESPEATFSPLDGRGDNAHPLRSVLKAEDGTIAQIDYFRPDGTLLVSDRRDVVEKPSRAVTMCDASGEPLGTWRSVWGLYHFWLDSLPRDPIAWFIIDSKTSANHFSQYQRPDAVTMHLVHGSHLAPGSPRPLGELTPGRKFVFENLKGLDAVVLLTSQQLNEVDALLGPADNRYVCANGRNLSSEPAGLDRPSHRGTMLASLTKRKRVSHAIKAMSRATPKFQLFGRRAVPHLDILGDGSRRPLLEKVVRRVKPTPSITFHGYVDDAPARLEQASFSLLTSTSEGQPLAIIESMAAGCIPISYDIPYGPADVITDGVNGFLVPDRDIDAMAAIIKRIAASPPKRLEAMRMAAFERSRDFDDVPITQRWGSIMRDAAASKNA